MSVIILAIGASFIVTVAAIPLVMRFAAKRGLYDDPSGDALKVHKKPVPTLGGLGIFAGFLAPMVVLSLYWMFGSGHWPVFDSVYGGLEPKHGVLILCSAAVVALGLADDMMNLNPRLRFFLQLCIAAMTVYFGFAVDTFPVWYIAAPLSLMYIMGSVNAVNLFDGLDGLAGGVVSVSLAGFSIIFYLTGNTVMLVVSLSLLGAVAGFLPYNFNPARIFMGDNGSTLLGYVLSVLALEASFVPYDMALFIIPIVLIGLPVMDTASAITRRYLNGRPIFIGDRSHIYDRLVDSGLSVRSTALVCYSIQACLVVGMLWWFYTHVVIA